MSSKKASNSDRSARAREAALTRHAFGDTKNATAAARAGFLERFRREVDPEGKLDRAERDRRANRLLRAYMSKLSRRRRKR